MNKKKKMPSRFRTSVHGHTKLKRILYTKTTDALARACLVLYIQMSSDGTLDTAIFK